MKLKYLYQSLRVIWKASPLYIISKVLFSLCNTVIGIMDVFLLKLILDGLNRNMELVLYILIIYTSISVFIQFIQSILQERIIPMQEEKVKYTIEINLYKEAERKELSLFDDSEFYDRYFFVLTNGKNNIINIVDNIIELISQIFMTVSMIGVVVYYDISMIFIVIFFVIISNFINLHKSRVVHDKYTSLIPNDRRIDYVNRIFYLKEFAAEIRIFDFFKVFNNIYVKAIKSKLNIIRKYSKKIIRASFIENSSQELLQFILLCYMSLKVFANELIISDFIVIFNSIAELNTQLLAIVSTIPLIYGNLLYIDDYFNFFEKNDVVKELSKEESINSITIKDLSYYYSEGNSVLEEVNLSFVKGEPSVIIGANGSGKTTLIKCICGVYSPKKGSILYNGVQIDRETIRKKSSVIFQDFQLYASTIADNILPDQIDNSEKERIVIDALKKVGLYEKISKLENGIYTEVTHEFSERPTISFSGGESQKIAIARAIAKNFDIIILDEPTSALDFVSEKNIFVLLNELCKDKILIYITHRLDAISNVKNIFLANNGKITNMNNLNKEEREDIISKAFMDSI